MCVCQQFQGIFCSFKDYMCLIVYFRFFLLFFCIIFPYEIFCLYISCFVVFWYRQWAILKNLYWTYISSGYMIHDKHIEMAFTIIIYNLFWRCRFAFKTTVHSTDHSGIHDLTKDEIDPCGLFLLFNHFMNWKCYQIKYSAFTIWFWTLMNHDFLKVCKNVLPMLQF